MVTSKLSSMDLRSILRGAFDSCAPLAEPHHVEQLFFLGDVAHAELELREQLREEDERFHDLVYVGGPDADPSVERQRARCSNDRLLCPETTSTDLIVEATALALFHNVSHNI